MKKFIDINAEARKVAKNDFERDIHKLNSNSVFGKTMENKKSRADIEILNGNDKGDEKRLLRRISKPNYGGAFIFENSQLVSVRMRPSTVLLDKPIQHGVSVLDRAKVPMYDWHYGYMKQKYGNNVELGYADTDSFIYDLIPKRQAAWNSGSMDAFRLYRNKINALCKSARSRYYNNNVANSLQSNPHKWWSTVKKIAGLAPSNNISTVIYSGNSCSDSGLANLLNDKFVAVGNTLPPFTWTPLAIDDVPSNFYLSVDDTEKALESSKRHTSVGPDGIPSWFLRENASLISRPLASIFNASIHEGFVPPLWKCANVTPIPKCFPISDIDSDVRPISLTPIVSKILESFLYNWLLQ